MVKKTKEKIKTEYCPKCKDVKLVNLNGKSEVFICENCKFKTVRKKKK